MLSTVLDQVTGQFDRRFLLNALFPTLVAALVATLVAAVGTGGIPNAVAWWEERPGVIQTLLIIGWVAGVVVLANMVANNVRFITRLFEGYAMPEALAGPARRYHLERANGLGETKRRKQYPLWPVILTESDVAATRLGNVLRNAETYPNHRYGIDAVRMWPLLYHLLEEGLRTSMAESRAAMEFMLVIALYAAVLGPSCAIALLCFEVPTVWCLAALGTGYGVATIAYVGSLAPARVYGNHLRAAFDLHRFKLLESLSLPLPATLAEERRIWARVEQFQDTGSVHRLRYVRSA